MATGSGCLVSALPARGEVWWSEMAETGRRPVVVLVRDAVIPRLRGDSSRLARRRFAGLPAKLFSNLVTTRSRGVRLSTWTRLKASRWQYVNRLGRLADTRMPEICGALG